MVGVDWLWTQTEEVSMEDTCRHRIVRAAWCVVLARDSVLWTPSGDGVLLPLVRRLISSWYSLIYVALMEIPPLIRKTMLTHVKTSWEWF